MGQQRRASSSAAALSTSRAQQGKDAAGRERRRRGPSWGTDEATGRRVKPVKGGLAARGSRALLYEEGREERTDQRTWSFGGEGVGSVPATLVRGHIGTYLPVGTVPNTNLPA